MDDNTLRRILHSHPATALRKIISQNNIKGYSNLRKVELIELMMFHKHRFMHLQPYVSSRTRKAKTKAPRARQFKNVKELTKALKEVMKPKAPRARTLKIKRVDAPELMFPIKRVASPELMFPIKRVASPELMFPIKRVASPELMYPIRYTNYDVPAAFTPRPPTTPYPKKGRPRPPKEPHPITGLKYTTKGALKKRQN